jgi:transposase, IS6 family
MTHWKPTKITTDKLASYSKAIKRLKREGSLAENVEHRNSKYLNNIIEADHGAFKPVIRRARGFKTMKTATARIKGVEIMRMIGRGHCTHRDPGAKGEVRFVNTMFGIAA